MIPKQSHYLGVAKNFFGTENEVWAGLGQLAILKKKIGADYQQLLGAVFSCFQGQKTIKFFEKYCSVCTKKLHNISFIYISLIFF